VFGAETKSDEKTLVFGINFVPDGGLAVANFNDKMVCWTVALFIALACCCTWQAQSRSFASLKYSSALLRAPRSTDITAFTVELRGGAAKVDRKGKVVDL
jgi:hypothetical protein